MVKLMKRTNKKFDFRTAFIDVLLNVLTSMIFIFVITTLVMQMAKVTEDGAPRKAEYIATVTWADNLDCDVDLWARDPDGVVVSFSNKNQDMMNLERDDLGFFNDAFSSIEQMINGDAPTLTTDQFNEETLVFRGIKKGKYILSVHLYSCRDRASGKIIPLKPGQPTRVEVNLKLMKINRYKVEYTKTVTFESVWQEIPLVEFTVNEKKEITNFDDTDVKLVRVKNQ